MLEIERRAGSLRFPDISLPVIPYPFTYDVHSPPHSLARPLTCSQGIVVGSTDGGKTWTQWMVGGGDYYWYGVTCVPLTRCQHVIISGFQDTAGVTQGIIRRTTDGGVHWSDDVVVDTAAWITGSVQFATDTDGFMLAALAGRGHVTTNGGKVREQRRQESNPCCCLCVMDV